MKSVLFITAIALLSCTKIISRAQPTWNDVFQACDSLHIAKIATYYTPNDHPDSIAKSIDKRYPLREVAQLQILWNRFRSVSKGALSDTALAREMLDSVTFYIIHRKGWDIGPEPWQSRDQGVKCAWAYKNDQRADLSRLFFNIGSALFLLNKPSEYRARTIWMHQLYAVEQFSSYHQWNTCQKR